MRHPQSPQIEELKRVRSTKTNVPSNCIWTDLIISPKVLDLVKVTCCISFSQSELWNRPLKSKNMIFKSSMFSELCQTRFTNVCGHKRRTASGFRSLFPSKCVTATSVKPIRSHDLWLFYSLLSRVVPIPVSENASDIDKYASLCTYSIPCDLLTAKQYPATSPLAQLALTDVTYLKTVILCLSKIVHRKKLCATTVNNYF